MGSTRGDEHIMLRRGDEWRKEDEAVLEFAARERLRILLVLGIVIAAFVVGIFAGMAFALSGEVKTLSERSELIINTLRADYSKRVEDAEASKEVYAGISERYEIDAERIEEEIEELGRIASSLRGTGEVEQAERVEKEVSELRWEERLLRRLSEGYKELARLASEAAELYRELAENLRLK